MNNLTLVNVPAEKFDSTVTVLERQMLQLEQTVTTPIHRFADGLYCRELFMPKDTLFVSRVHKYDSIAIVTKGDISILQKNGTFRMTAPVTASTNGGTKRIGLTHEDTIFITVHALPEGMNENTPIEEIEAYLACDTLDDYENELKRLLP